MYPQFQNVVGTLMGFSKGLQNEFEAAVANKPSVLEPPKFYMYLYNW